MRWWTDVRLCHWVQHGVGLILALESGEGSLFQQRDVTRREEKSFWSLCFDENGFVLVTSVSGFG